jgi:hypothetical protein
MNAALHTPSGLTNTLIWMPPQMKDGEVLTNDIEYVDINLYRCSVCNQVHANVD